MRKYFAAAALFAATGAAQAVDLELGAGWAQYQSRGNMMWYQEGLPYKLDLNAPVIEAGLAGNIIQRGRYGLDWHAGYVWMGNARSDAIATPDDRNYDKVAKSCIGECIGHTRFVGSGNVQGIKLTLEPNITHNGIRFGVEAGAFVFRPTWDVAVYDWVACKGCEPRDGSAHGDRGIRVSPVVGASIGYKNVSLAYTYYMNLKNKAPTHSLYQSAHTITVRYRF